jgi:Flp pilus assembly protein CpaB
MKPFWSSFVAGLVLAGVVIVALVAFSFSRQAGKVREAWALTPVAVASQKIAVGQTITFDHLSQRSIPVQFATDSMVRPDEVSTVINRSPTVPLEAGDPLLWAAFADNSATDACFSAIAPKVRAAGVKAREETIARFEQRLGPPLPAPEPAPEPQVDASGHASGVVLTRDVPEGKVLEESMLAVASFPRGWVTPSIIPADRLRDVIGTRTIVALQARDTLRWQMLDDAERPRRAASCTLEADSAQEEARGRTTREESAAFVRGKEAQP